MKEQIKYIISCLIIISITVIWVNAWNWLTASNWDTLDVSKWNQLVTASVPNWSVMAFNLSSCPTWWIAADWTNSTPDLRWTFIRWIWWDANSRDITRTLWEYQDDQFESHTHYRNTYNASEFVYRTWTSENWATIWSPNRWQWLWETWNPNSWKRWNETRPKNIALLYCIKQ